MTKKKPIKHQKQQQRKQQEATSEKQQSFEEEDIVFSFKYLDLHGNPKFSIAGCGESYIEKLLLRLKDISAIKFKDFAKPRSPSLRAHKIDWKKTTEPNGFTTLNAYFREQTAFPFQISANDRGRVHGFLVQRIFYIVWLDPHHNLYS